MYIQKLNGRVCTYYMIIYFYSQENINRYDLIYYIDIPDQTGQLQNSVFFCIHSSFVVCEKHKHNYNDKHTQQNSDNNNNNKKRQFLALQIEKTNIFCKLFCIFNFLQFIRVVGYFDNILNVSTIQGHCNISSSHGKVKFIL